MAVKDVKPIGTTPSEMSARGQAQTWVTASSGFLDGSPSILRSLILSRGYIALVLALARTLKHHFL